MIFASSVWRRLRKSLIIQAIFPSDKRVPRSTRWNKKIAQQQEAVQPQQIQALLANVEELTHQNEELRKTMESQNVERRQTGENQNEEESNSQANRRDRTSGEDSSKMESELRNIRKEMDELKSATKDKGRENSDGMIRRTDSPFTTEVLNRPLPPKFCLL